MNWLGADGAARRARRAKWIIGASALALGIVAAGPAPAQTTPSVTLLQAPPGADDGNTYADGISGDGHVAVGSANTPGDDFVIWRDGVPQVIALNESQVGAPFHLMTNSDGSVIVAEYTDSEFFYLSHAMVWTAATGAFALPDLGPRDVAVGTGGVSADGHYIAVNVSHLALGTGYPQTNCSNVSGEFCLNQVYRWSQAGGYEAIPELRTYIAGPNGRPGMYATAISGNGSIIVGSFTPDSSSAAFLPFIWREGVGSAQLPLLPDTPADGFTTPNAISRDGSTIVGLAEDMARRNRAVVWQNGAIASLGWLPGTQASDLGQHDGAKALGVSADGSVIVGTQATFGNIASQYYGFRAWRWTFATGMQDLNKVAHDAGIDLGGYVLEYGVGVSENGQTILGQATSATAGTRAFVFSMTQLLRTETQTRLLVVVRLPGVTLQSVVNQSFQTNVRGTLNGDQVFSRDFASSIASNTGQQALADAYAALQAQAGLRRIAISEPRLVSTTTTVTGQTSNIVDVLTGTQTTTANVVTTGPATVLTGDRGTCVTAASNGQDPTGCSLPGTAVQVPSGTQNTNIYTNTINSVTPTTTNSVNQLVTSQWEVAASATNQFGTVHALAGRAGFDRGLHLLDETLTLGTMRNGDNRTPETSQLVGDSGLRIFGEYYGSWQRLSGDAGAAVAATRGNTNGFTTGLGFDNGDDLRLGAVVDYGKTDMDVRDPVAPEHLDLNLTQIGAYAGWSTGRLSLSGAAGFGFGKVRTTIADPGGASNARRNLHIWALGAGLRYAVIDESGFTLDAESGARHAAVTLGRFTAVSGPFPLAGNSQTLSRTRFYAGLAASGHGDFRLWAYVRGAYDAGNRSGSANVVFAGEPGLGTFQAVGPRAGRIGAEVGAGLEARLSDSLRLSAGYEGAYRDGERSHMARAGLSLAF